MTAEFCGELLGTAILVLLGNGVVAGVLLKRSFGYGAGWVAITAGWAFAVMAGVFAALAVGSKAHLNPAVTIGIAITTGDWSRVVPYIVAQFLGAMLGALLVWLHYLPHWRETEDAAAKLACFCTSPAVRNIPSNLFSEIVGTFVLVLVAQFIYSTKIAPTGPAAGLGPLLIGCLVWGIGLSLGGTTGYAINPARDLGPRVMHALLPVAGKGTSNWNYAGIPIAGPLLGACLAGLLAHRLAM
jgi:glycerol uptake facilitator protein